jgi:hypothetical protein
MSNQRECLPVGQVLDTVFGVERDTIVFYEAAAQDGGDQELATDFARLLAEKRESGAELARVCDEYQCGSALAENASQDDLLFLSVLAESGFYGPDRKSAVIAGERPTGVAVVNRAFEIERNLLLFYTKFYGISCAKHRPFFSKLISRGQRHMAELNYIRRRLTGPPRR